ncbi:MAG: fibronectin type III domain-containing protein [Candidatus Cloacimonetes bacterium]|nr:fibronectin type III domain-containing protein [Candidatus Cloacimonadota bacterium]
MFKKVLFFITIFVATTLFAQETRPDLDPVRNFEEDWNVNSVTYSWDAPLDTTGLINYKVYRDSSHIASTVAFSFTDSPSLNGYYLYYVTALYNYGESVPSQTYNAPICTAHPPLNVNASVNGADVTITWSPPVDTGFLLYYRVERIVQLVGYTENVGTTTSTSMLDEDVPNGEYAYRVTAYYNYAGQFPSSLAAVTVVNWEIPSNLTVSIVGSNAVLNWSAPDDDLLLDGYYIYRNGSRIDFVQSYSTTYSDPLNNRERAFYQVSASYRGF